MEMSKHAFTRVKDRPFVSAIGPAMRPPVNMPVYTELPSKAIWLAPSANFLASSRDTSAMTATSRSICCVDYNTNTTIINWNHETPSELIF